MVSKVREPETLKTPTISAIEVLIEIAPPRIDLKNRSQRRKKNTKGKHTSTTTIEPGP
jgi:hypothetical protein